MRADRRWPQLLRGDAAGLTRGGEGEIDSGHPGPRAARAVAKVLRRPKSLPAILSNSRFGGEGEIRTHEGREALPVFKTGAFNRSATSPISDSN